MSRNKVLGILLFCIGTLVFGAQSASACVPQYSTAFAQTAYLSLPLAHADVPTDCASAEAIVAMGGFVISRPGAGEMLFRMSFHVSSMQGFRALSTKLMGAQPLEHAARFLVALERTAPGLTTGRHIEFIWDSDPAQVSFGERLAPGQHEDCSHELTARIDFLTNASKQGTKLGKLLLRSCNQGSA